MMGQSITACGSAMDNRTFIYEVEGLNQNTQPYKAIAPIRNSGGLLFSVPHSRMNSFMTQMHRLGGKIVAIHSSWENATKSEPTVAEADQSSAES